MPTFFSPSSLAPAPAQIGDTWYNNASHLEMVFTDQGWTSISSVGVGGTSYGSGDQMAPQGVNIIGQLIDVLSGTVASPDTTGNPLVRVSRTFSGTAGAPFVGSPVDQVASISGSTLATTTSSIQVVGISGYAETQSAQAAGTNGAAD